MSLIEACFRAPTAASMAGRAAPDFRPGGQHGNVLTREEYVRRRDETTKQELAKCVNPFVVCGLVLWI